MVDVVEQSVLLTPEFEHGCGVVAKFVHIDVHGAIEEVEEGYSHG